MIPWRTAIENPQLSVDMAEVAARCHSVANQLFQFFDVRKAAVLLAREDRLAG